MAYLYPEESHKILELAMLLHRELGCGFKEKVYQDAFEVLLKENNIPYEREKRITIQFHGIELQHDFFYDFLCYGKIGVELKTYSEITGEFEAQMINYLHVSGHALGVILNFGLTSLDYRWYINKHKYSVAQQQFLQNSK
ncbi:MAG: GxxExxY protein [Bacteroidaceae bacterium]|nr:GxxExxY protein [Bacteroidaceae bacterium]